MPAPATSTDVIFPDWTNLVDNWREQDAEWLRNRTVQMFTTEAIRTSVMGGKTVFGMVSILPVGSTLAAGGVTVGGPDFWNGTAWESVRYANLNVASAAGSAGPPVTPASATMKYVGAGSGVQMFFDGSVNIAKLVTGTGVVAGYTGAYLDNTGIAVKVGTKTVKLATDAANLTIDSPVSIAGALAATGAISAPTLNVPNINSSGTIAAAAVTASSLDATGLVKGGTVRGGDVLLGTSGVLGTIKNFNGGTSQIGVGSDSSVQIGGTSISLGGTSTATTVGGPLTVNGLTTLVGATSLAPAGKTAVALAGIVMQLGNVAPTANNPDGTIYVTY